MPGALRRASRENCFRVDGTRSERRTYLEFQGKNRLRLDMLAVMFLVFLSGNACYYLFDTYVAPVPSVALKVSEVVFGESESGAVSNHEDQIIESSQEGKLIDAERFERRWPLLVVVVVVWSAACLYLVSLGAMRAYRSFADGVRRRSDNYFRIDMTRVSISEAETERLHQTGSGTGADVA